MKTCFALLSVVIAAFVTNVRANSTPPLLPVGAPAPDFTAHTADGRPVKLSDYQGKVVLLDLWASWCPACLVWMPKIETIHQQFAPRGLVVLGLNVLDMKDELRRWQRNPRVETTYLKIFDGALNGPNSIARTLYPSGGGVPAVYLITKDRKIAYAGTRYDIQGEAALRAAVMKQFAAAGPSIPGGARQSGAPVPVRK